MMPGQSYYVLVNKENEELEEVDPITGYQEIMKFDSWEEAGEALDYFFQEDLLFKEEGWHVERNKW